MEKLERFSPEWMEQLERMAAAAQRYAANKNDRAALDEFVKAGEKIGWVVPIDPGK